MYSSTPDLLKKKIISKSKQDTISGLTRMNSYPCLIPEELAQVLINDVKPFANMSEAAENYYHVLKGLNNFKTYTQDIYWYIHKLLLYLDYYQGIVDMRQYNLCDQVITPSQRRPKEFIIRVPGLAEDRPSVRIRDEVEIVQVAGNNHSFGIIEFVGQDYVSVSLSLEFNKNFEPTQKYNIEFQYSTWQFDNMNFVLDTVYKQQLISMLFPVQQSSCTVNKTRFEWINHNIKHNPEQQQAVVNIINKTPLPAPYILFGPPGTGKTSTVVEAICQISRCNPSNRILICTPSNAAADEIAMRLLKNSIDENIMYRMYSASKNSDDVNVEIKAFSNISDTESVFISKDVFLRKKIVITTLATCIRLYKYDLHENHFSYLFCDEAGQATELETLIPLVLMSGADTGNVSQFCGQIILAGDPKQLGPVISSQRAKPLMSISLLERLMEWGPYRKNNSNKYDPMYVTKLVQNYRCHPAILYLPNELFYDGELVANANVGAWRAENWSGLIRRKFPIIFRAVEGAEERERHSPSIFNEKEVLVVVDFVKRLLNDKLGGKRVNPNEIGIITPYRLQKSKIQRALEDKKIEGVSVGTVEIFQGQERDIIIISTVRTKLYLKNNQIHIGFLSHPKRFNVAITRAKALVIVVGDPNILQHDRCWRALLQYCIENKACSGPNFLLSTHVEKANLRKLIAKKHIVDELNKSNTDEPVNEISDFESDNRNDDVNRRRRIPIGPLPETFNYTSKVSNISENILHRINDAKFHQAKIDARYDYDNDSDDVNNDNDYEQYSTGCSVNDCEDYYLGTDNPHSSSSGTILWPNSVPIKGTNTFETELQNRMLILAINEDS